LEPLGERPNGAEGHPGGKEWGTLGRMIERGAPGEKGPRKRGRNGPSAEKKNRQTGKAIRGGQKSLEENFFGVEKAGGEKAERRKIGE